ncbi:hypothetical protein CRE_17193 [Caenorhabditis remanei]|uniref:Uncharacterized protein n=1 Tax=Caenorhabditis remanei TaxID=31234 RepID=E3M9Z8_CAERE|nr:hypothetical protein CRE_17193 [Caenorhabditis remanei]
MVRLLDGSMSAQLKHFGYDCNSAENIPHWTFPANSDESLVANAYKSFLDLGVTDITTNTYHFGSTLDKRIPENDSKKKIYEKYFKIACSSLVKLTEMKDGVRVWGSVGTLATLYHDMSEYNGKYMDNEDAENTARNYYQTILTLFQTKTKVRNLVFETIPLAVEGLMALEALKRFPEMRAVMSFTFKENACLRHGEEIDTLAGELRKCSQIVGMGINCTDPENVLPALKVIKKHNFPEVFVYPNMGDSKFLNEGSDESDVFNIDMVTGWVENGATAIGGCCGVTEAQMKILKKIVDNLNNAK